MTHNKKCFVLFFSLIFAVILLKPCNAAGNREQQSVTEHKPAVNGLVFIGVSPRLLNRAESIQTALIDAARKLSFFYSVSAFSENIQHTGMTAMDINIDSSYQLKYDNDLDKYLELLEYNIDNDIFENNNAFFIITRVSSVISIPAFRGHSISQTRPYWIDAPPSQIGGFTAGVGFSSRFISHRDTVVRSYEKAVISIIEKMEIHVHGDHLLYQNTDDYGLKTYSLGGSSTSGILENFYVIESWTDPSSLSVWTLAIASDAR